MMKVIPRRKYHKPSGDYFESDRDYVLNNIDAAVQLLDRAVQDRIKCGGVFNGVRWIRSAKQVKQ